MRRWERIWIGAILLCVLFALLSGCGNASPSSEAILRDFLSAYGDLPAGQCYDTAKKEWEVGYLPTELLESLYGGERGEAEYLQITDAAVYLSATPFAYGEAAVCYAPDRATRDALSKMFLRRISLVRSLRGHPDLSAMQGRVAVRGKYVIFYLLEDGDRADRALASLP